MSVHVQQYSIVINCFLLYGIDVCSEFVHTFLSRLLTTPPIPNFLGTYPSHTLQNEVLFFSVSTSNYFKSAMSNQIVNFERFSRRHDYLTTHPCSECSNVVLGERCSLSTTASYNKLQTSFSMLYKT